MKNACETMAAYANIPCAQAINAVRECLETFRYLNRGHLEKSAMIEKFREIQPGQVMILHVVEQNAALLIHCTSRSVLQANGGN
jgi:hypothetical protein